MLRRKRNGPPRVVVLLLVPEIRNPHPYPKAVLSGSASRKSHPSVHWAQTLVEEDGRFSSLDDPGVLLLESKSPVTARTL